MPEARNHFSYQLDQSQLVKAEPRLAAYITLILVRWNLLEDNTSALVVAMLSRHQLVASAPMRGMIGAVITLGTRLELIEGASASLLPKSMQAELKLLLTAIRRRASERDRMAHSAWYTSSEKPNRLIRVPRPKEFIIGAKSPKSEAYSEKDFASVVGRIDELNKEILDFTTRCLALRASERTRKR